LIETWARAPPSIGGSIGVLLTVLTVYDHFLTL
jgi:hypothetical protein